MLSLPDYWDYSLAGLAAICKDGKDCICSTINEIEAHSYIKKNGRMRNDLGQLCDTEYAIYEKPMLENQTQLSSKKLNKQVSNTDLSSINQSNSDVMEAMKIYKQIIFNNIEYDIISEQYDREQLNEIVEIMLGKQYHKGTEY